MASASHSMLAAGVLIRRRFGLAKIPAHVNSLAWRGSSAATRDTRSYSSNGFVEI